MHRNETLVASLASIEMKKEARSYIRSLNAKGSTNIYSALSKAFAWADEAKNEKIDSTVLVFLSDGKEATSGETVKLEEIIDRLEKNYTVPVLSLVMDPHSNMAFVNKLARSTQGIARRLFSGEYNESAFEKQVKNFATAIKWMASKEWKDSPKEYFAGDKADANEFIRDGVARAAIWKGKEGTIIRPVYAYDSYEYDKNEELILSRYFEYIEVKNLIMEQENKAVMKKIIEISKQVAHVSGRVY